MLADKDLVSIQETRSKVEKAYAAWQKYRSYSQEQVDAIVERMAAAGRAHARRLAELAVEETGYGNANDKLAKNLLCADLLPRKMRGLKTVGVLRELPEERVVEIAVPVGVVAAILPTTNPTSTAIFKILISLKAGNAIVVSPHPNALHCTCETVDVLYRAAIEAGAPEFIDLLTSESTDYQLTLGGGIAWLDSTCTDRYGKVFLACAPAQQKEILDLVAYRASAAKDAALGPGVKFFAFLRNLTLDGFLTSEIGFKYLQYIGNTYLAEFPGCPPLPAS